MERMMMIELDSYMQELKKALAGRLSGKLDEDDIKFLMGTVNQFIEGLIKVMRERKSVHEKYFSDIILNSPDAIIGFDKKNEIFLWNNGAVNLFGYAREEAIGKDFGIIIPDKIKEKEPDSEIVFFGTNRGLENDLVPRAGYKLITIEAYGIQPKITIKNIYFTK